MKHTYVALLLDASSSMQPLRNAARDTFNGMLKTIKDNSKDGKNKTTVVVYTFADMHQLLIPATPAEKVGLIPVNDYFPNGNTALFHTMSIAVHELTNLSKADNRKAKKRLDSSFLIMAVTDGEDNRSALLGFSESNLASMIHELGEEEWTFAMSVPKGHYKSALVRRGIPEGNINEWEISARGIADVAVAASAGLGGYFQGISNGQNATRGFFTKVTTDLSGVSKRDVKRTLDNVTSAFKVIEAKVESAIKPLVESKTKSSYVVGDAFYQLMKTEKVQPQKDVLLMRKDTGEIFGGDGARDIIGLPDGEHAKVTPGNHSDYDIFVQSTSTNRIVPRGTKVLVKS